MSTLDAKAVVPRSGTNYLPQFAHVVQGREKRVLGDVFGLTQFGVNLTTLAPGSASALRHWHAREDEFVFVVSGEITLIDDLGEHVLTPGMCAGFKAGVANGHCLVNKSAASASYIEIGTRASEESAEYPDVDLKAEKRAGKWSYMKKDGTPY
jgi:uncharacterized cupin superfamily protein